MTRIDVNDRLQDNFFLFIIIFIYGIFVFPFIHRYGFGEPDSVLQWVTLWSNPYEYQVRFISNMEKHFGWYIIFDSLYDLLPLSDKSGSTSILLLNFLHSLISLVSLIVLYFLIKKITSSKYISFLAVGICLLTPLYWETSTYSHPVIPSFFFALLALYFFIQYIDGKHKKHLLLSFLFMVTCLAMRGDGILIFPTFLGILVYSHKIDKANLLVFLLYSLAVVLAYLIFRRIVFNVYNIALPAGGFINNSIDFFRKYYQTDSVFRGFLHFIKNFGIATFFVFLLGFYFFYKNRNFPLLLCSILSMVPVLLFYAGNHPPPRHFIGSLIGFILLTALFVAKLTSLRNIMFFFICLIFLNLVLPPSLYLLQKFIFPDRRRMSLTYNMIERNLNNRAYMKAVLKQKWQPILSGNHDSIIVLGDNIEFVELLWYMVKYFPDFRYCKTAEYDEFKGNGKSIKFFTFFPGQAIAEIKNFLRQIKSPEQYLFYLPTRNISKLDDFGPNYSFFPNNNLPGVRLNAE